jgi:hypothetical protein
MPKKLRPTLVIAGVALAALILFLTMRRTGPAPIELRGPVSTLAEGYERIQPLRNQIAHDAQLTAAVVDLERSEGKFQVLKIIFAFGPTQMGRSGVSVITVDNVNHTAYCSAEFPKSSAALAGTERTFAPLDAAPIPTDVPEVLDVAKDKGLDEFCNLVPTADQQIELRLRSGQRGPVWHVVGQGRLDSGSAAALRVIVDARTGAVVSHELTRGEDSPRDAIDAQPE